MKYALLRLDGMSRMVVCAGPSTKIGRETGNEIVIQDAKVSKFHAQILLGERGASIHDQNSLNGTWVNDKRVQSIQTLHHLDVIRIGTAVFRFFQLTEHENSDLGLAIL